MTLNVSLTPQLEEMVRQKVQSGLYNSASELVREALRLIEERDQVRAMRHEALKKAIEEGMKGPYSPADEVFDRLEKKYLAMIERQSS